MIDPQKYGTIAEAAAAAGLNPSTLGEAVRRGAPGLEIRRTAGGTRLVSLKSAKRYAAKPAGRGRPRKSTKTTPPQKG